MAESTDDAPDLSRDTKLKKVFRDVCQWYFGQEKPSVRTEMPWYYPNKKIDGWFTKDPIRDPPDKYEFENKWNYK